MREGTAVAGRYRLIERVGAGGMGEVWRATDELLGRTVAVKVVLPSLHADPDFGRRFVAEARAMASVHHPGVVTIHDFGEIGDPDAGRQPGTGRVAYLVMEFVAGEPLSHLLKRVGRLTPSATMDLVGRAAHALQAVHDHGVVHRDVKPANLMVRSDGSIALADFGIAVVADATALTAPGAVLGTPSYLAPEQVLGQPASARSDVYALGLVAYECLVGQKPFQAEDPFGAALQRVQRAAPPLPPDVPPQVAGVVSRALATDPGQRWQTAAELAAAAGLAVGPAGAAGLAVGPAGAAGLAVGPAGAAGLAVGPAGAAGLAVGPAAAAGRPAGAVPAGGSGRRRRRWSRPLVAAVAVAVTALLLATGTAVLRELQEPSADDSRRSTLGDGAVVDGAVGDGTVGDLGDRSAPALPAGFAACGDALCPVAPRCWRGLVQQGDRAFPPGAEPCTAPHYWESFAATYLPAGATTDRDLSRLMERADVAAVCSETTMAGRSRDRAETEGWRREAWPIPADASTVLVHCLAGSPDGETAGAAFTPAG